MAIRQARQSRALPLCLLCLIAPFADAHAQTTVDPRMERDTVGARSRPEVETAGARVGALLISPSFGIEADATDNIYARSDTKRGDVALAILPALAVRSQWSRHALGLSAEGTVKRYARRTTENIETYAVKLDGRLDLSGDTRLSGDIGTARRIEPRGTTGDTLFGAAPIAFTQLSGGGEIEQTFARARLTIAGRYERFLYEDRELGGTLIDLSQRDYEALTGSFRAAIGVGPGVATFASLAYNRNRYLTTPAGQPSRDSHGFTLLTGVAFGLNRLLQGELGVGWVRQDFNAPVFPRISGLAYNAQLRWSPTRLTTVRLSGGRTFQRSPIIGVAGIQQHEVTLSAEHELLRTLILRPSLRYLVADFQVPTGAAKRQERYFTGAFGATWRLTQHLEVAADYAHSLGRNSGAVDPGRAYDRNRATISIRWRL
ncbi:outer membrane beta-barrel protein [Novosphingobium sp. AAP93]|uniref:outer membrane beta-barrel protein n=1 Tax=Novosphingobium sp. AAP93 TaxID=1523427 RepID=UPI0006CC1AFF|nr:outer membrane beta-barrel protein [Novosphingobium sp. AAP93]KPF78831.1 hypothetical protein IP83_17825 [Novosphingobium sp. AAP93]